MIGVNANDEKIIREIITQTAPNCTVVAFGSRVKGGHRDTSDLDLAFAMPRGERLSLSQLGDIKECFQESDLRFRVDVLDYNDTKQYFRDIIDAGGTKIYPA